MTPTHAAWLALAGYVAAADAWLLRKGHASMSALAQRHPVVAAAGCGLLGVHLARAWRYDPLHLLGLRIARNGAPR